MALGFAVLVGCAAPWEDAEDGASAQTARARPKQITVCFAGASVPWDPYATDGNPQLAEICKSLPNLVRPSATRDAQYPFHPWDSNEARVRADVRRALDSDRSGKVDASDEPFELNVIGYSWGGFNGLDLVEAISRDAAYAPPQRVVARFIALDAYAIGFDTTNLRVPQNVREFYSFRHLKEPPTGCSQTVNLAIGEWIPPLAGIELIGPFVGKAPLCTGSTACHDFDLGADDSGLDHCGLPAKAEPYLKRILLGEALGVVPGRLPVARH